MTSPVEFHCKGFNEMPRKTQEALVEMVSCLSDLIVRIPKGFNPLPVGSKVERGDFWRRTTDGVWIETGTAHWGTEVKQELEFARR